MILIPRSPCHLLPGQSFSISKTWLGKDEQMKFFSVPRFHEFFSNIWKFENKNIRFFVGFSVFFQGENTPRIPDFSCRRNTWSSSPRKDTACPVRRVHGTIKRPWVLIPGGKSVCRKLSGVNNWNGGIFIGYYGGGGLWELHGSFWKWKKPLWIYRVRVFGWEVPKS